VSGDSTTLCPDYDNSCDTSGGGAPDAVFHVTPNIAGRMTVDTLGSVAELNLFDPIVYARGTCADQTTELACDDANPPTEDSITFHVEAGQTYYLFLDGYEQSAGAYKVNVVVVPRQCGDGYVESPEECDDGNKLDGDGCSHDCKKEPGPPHDACPGEQLTLTQVGSAWQTTWTETTLGLWADYEGTCGGDEASDAVAQFNSGPGGTAKLLLTESGTLFDAVLYVRSGDCASGTEVACNDAFYDGGDQVTFQAPPNTTYWVFVDGYSSESGVFELQVSVIPPGCGNGHLELNEQCDDGNQSPNDGCSATCLFEGGCGHVAEIEPNPYDAPQVIPAACQSFVIQPAAMPAGDVDYFLLNLVPNAVVHANTFVGTPDSCTNEADTVLSLWKGPVPAGTATSGACDAGVLVCNDDDAGNKPCSRVNYTVPAGQGGDYVLKAHNFFSTKPIAGYGLFVMVE
jgi:cysteine-rich repeat protein